MHNDELLMDSTPHKGLYHLNLRDDDPFAFAGITGDNKSPNSEDNSNQPEHSENAKTEANPTEQTVKPPTNPSQEANPTDQAVEPPDPPTETPGFNFNDRVWALHQDLRHISLKAIARLADMSKGMSVSKKEIKAQIGQTCPVCKVTTAVVRIPRDPASRTSTAPGDLLHINV